MMASWVNDAPVRVELVGMQFNALDPVAYERPRVEVVEYVLRFDIAIWVVELVVTHSGC